MTSERDIILEKMKYEFEAMRRKDKEMREEHAKRHVEKECTLPPGTYYIGDPCYVVDEWDDFLAVMEWNGGLFQWKGYPVFINNTAFGDGGYAVVEERYNANIEVGSVGVDAGLICIMPASLGSDILSYEHTFHLPFKCSYEDGVFRFGYLKIDTN